VTAGGVEEIEGRLLGNEEQAGIGNHAFGLVVERHPGFIESVSSVAVELRVLISRDVGLGPLP
jgi:hypothetical protein